MNNTSTDSLLLYTLVALKRLFLFRVRTCELDYRDTVINWNYNHRFDYKREFTGTLSDHLSKSRAVLEAQVLVARQYCDCGAASAQKGEESSAEVAVSKSAANRAISTIVRAEELVGWLFGYINTMEDDLEKLEHNLAEQAIDPGWD
jgi:hypothetical protein